MGKWGGVLHALQRAVDLERLYDVLRTLGLDVGIVEPAREGGLPVSAAADTFRVGYWARGVHT